MKRIAAATSATSMVKLQAFRDNPAKKFEDESVDADVVFKF
jgi:hypothetical protein